MYAIIAYILISNTIDSTGFFNEHLFYVCVVVWWTIRDWLIALCLRQNYAFSTSTSLMPSWMMQFELSLRLTDSEDRVLEWKRHAY